MEGLKKCILGAFFHPPLGVCCFRICVQHLIAGSQVHGESFDDRAWFVSIWHVKADEVFYMRQKWEMVKIKSINNCIFIANIFILCGLKNVFIKYFLLKLALFTILNLFTKSQFVLQHINLKTVFCDKPRPSIIVPLHNAWELFHRQYVSIKHAFEMHWPISRLCWCNLCLIPISMFMVDF